MSIQAGSRRRARAVAPNPARSAQRPSPEGGTRRTVLRLIAEHGPVTAAEVAETLDITPTAVRRHVGALEADGFVAEQDPVPSALPRGRGRPARNYVVTTAGHASMQGSYDDVANEVLRYLAERLGPEAVEEFAQQRAERFVARYTPIVHAAGDDPAVRAEALAEALSSDGFAATARAVEGAADASLSHGVQLCQGHCPVQSVAAEYGEFCEAEKDAFARLLGVHVQRLSTLAAGGHVCTTFVPSPALRPGLEPRPAGHGPPDDEPAAAAYSGPRQSDRTPMTIPISERTPR